MPPMHLHPIHRLDQHLHLEFLLQKLFRNINTPISTSYISTKFLDNLFSKCLIEGVIVFLFPFTKSLVFMFKLSPFLIALCIYIDIFVLSVKTSSFLLIFYWDYSFTSFLLYLTNGLNGCGTIFLKKLPRLLHRTAIPLHKSLCNFNFNSPIYNNYLNS